MCLFSLSRKVQGYRLKGHLKGLGHLAGKGADDVLRVTGRAEINSIDFLNLQINPSQHKE